MKIRRNKGMRERKGEGRKEGKEVKLRVSEEELEGVWVMGDKVGMRVGGFVKGKGEGRRVGEGKMN
ncbi:hypothetical protein, partial [Priestia megaterium]|uniref:hypothetical protein n=1 Tax=Priestia megaterium TaxID=1404 RepID=UPI0012B933B8